MRYFNYDYDDNHTLISSFGSNKVSFVSLNQTINGFTTNLVEYEFFEDKLLRKQFLTSNPANILKINKGNLSIGNDADFCIEINGIVIGL